MSFYPSIFPDSRLNCFTSFSTLPSVSPKGLQSACLYSCIDLSTKLIYQHQQIILLALVHVHLLKLHLKLNIGFTGFYATNGVRRLSCNLRSTQIIFNDFFAKANVYILTDILKSSCRAELEVNRINSVVGAASRQFRSGKSVY